MTGRYFSLPADDPNGWNWRNLQDKSISSTENSIANIQMENVGSTNYLFIDQENAALNPGEVSIVAPPDNPESISNSDEDELNISSPPSPVDDDTNDKDYQIDELPLSDCSDSEDSQSELDDGEVKDNAKDNDIILKNNKMESQTKESLASRLKNQNDSKTRRVMCIFCEEEIISKNFVRHLTRKHSTEKEVRKILSEPLNSKGRKQAMATLRKETTFERFLEGETLPARRNLKDVPEKNQESSYYPCTLCKGLYKKSYLRKHVKLCNKEISKDRLKDQDSNAVSKSQTFTACHRDKTNTVARLEVKEKVFDLMRGDEIAFTAKKDLLITYFGNSYLKKHRKEKSAYTCSNKMREFARLLIECRKLLNDQKMEMQNLLRPRNFDTIVTAARNLSGYDIAKKSFAAPSLALHYGGNLKLLCEELYHLALKDTKGFRSRTSTERASFLKDIKNIKQLIMFRWNIEMASLANKDLQEKKWNKPLLIPLVSDIKIFREETYKITEKCVEAFKKNKNTEKDYKILVECVLSLLIIFNRRRIGDVQYMKISDYKNEQKSNFRDFEDALSATEKVLATRYRRVLNSGKGSRAVVVLIPEDIDRFIQVMLKHRNKYIPEENDYLFSIPGHKVKWGRGDIAIRNLTKRMPLENAAAITSNRLRKQIATVMQILSLSKGDIKQFSNFMGHTVKTHEEFYELPIDVYQTAKVSKMLLMIENGVPVEHKGKSLSEIDIDFQYAEETGFKELQSNYDDGVRSQVDDIDEEVPEINEITFNKEFEEESSRSSNSTKLAKKKKQKNTIANNNEIIEEKEDNFSESESLIGATLAKKRERRKTIAIYNETDLIMEQDKEKEMENEVKSRKRQRVDEGEQKRKGWTPKEVALLKKAFSKYLAKNIYPPSAEIRKFLDDNQILREPVTVKSKLQHLIKLKNKSKK